MGCSGSREKVCQNCQVPLNQRVSKRSKSMHVHHLPENNGDSYHLVSLTSSTLGSLRLDPSQTDHYYIEGLETTGDVVAEVVDKNNKEFVLVEAKTWSKMLEEKIPKAMSKTTVQAPFGAPGEPETINAWELMEGLEDTSPLSHLHNQNHRLRSVSFHGQSSAENSIFYDDRAMHHVEDDADQETISVGLDVADHDNESHSHSDSASFIPEFDPEVISAFRKEFEKLSPAGPFHLKQLISETGQALMKEFVESEVSDGKKNNGIIEDYKSPRLEKEKLVLYFTSLRGVRKTYEDCCHVRVILKGLGVKIDEKDVSMHLGFRDELKELLGEGYPGGGLPKLFIGTKFIGGAEEIRWMNEVGQLEKLVERCEKLEDNRTPVGGNGGACEACGDITFMPCNTCSGSCKIFHEGDFNEENVEDECGFQRCPNCNENGLIRCPVCCD